MPRRLKLRKVRILVLLTLISLLSFGLAHSQTAGGPLPAWTEGTLDIHHISTGSGNSAFFVFPDGTTLLVDAGALGRRTERHVAPRPDDSRGVGEWIARFI